MFGLCIVLIRKEEWEGEGVRLVWSQPGLQPSGMCLGQGWVTGGQTKWGEVNIPRWVCAHSLYMQQSAKFPENPAAFRSHCSYFRAVITHPVRDCITKGSRALGAHWLCLSLQQAWWGEKRLLIYLKDSSCPMGTRAEWWQNHNFIKLCLQNIYLWKMERWPMSSSP